MNYEKPIMEIIVLNLDDVVTLSGEGDGSGGNYTGPWE